MKIKYFLPLLFLTGCASTKFVEQQSETLSEGVYATGDSIKVGRIDLASDYATDVEKIVVPPKTRITIKPIVNKDKDVTTILPQNLQTQKVVYVNSPDYVALEAIQSDNQQLKSELDKEKQFEAQSGEQAIKDKKVLNDLLIDDNAQKAKIANYEKSIFYKAYQWYVFLSWAAPIVVILLVVGLIALCVFVPPAIPIVLSVISNLFTALSNLVFWLIKKL